MVGEKYTIPQHAITHQNLRSDVKVHLQLSIEQHYKEWVFIRLFGVWHISPPQHCLCLLYRSFVSILIQVHIVRLSYRHAIQYHFDRLNLLEISRIIKKKYGFYHFSDNGTQKNSSAATMRLQITELFFGGPISPIGPIVYSCIKSKAHHCLPHPRCPGALCYSSTETSETKAIHRTINFLPRRKQ